jgi:sialic acid synthase SpsE
MSDEIKIIAEVSSNHGGSIELAKEFIKIAAQIGSDYVKFQTYRYEDLAKKDDPQADWVKKTELPSEVYPELIEECKKNEIKFITTCFSLKYVNFLSSLKLEEIKVASPDLLNFKMIEALAQRFKHLIISTGMHTIQETEKAIKFLNENKIKATLLHAVSLYPTSLEKAWMNKFLWLKSVYPRVGYSDHTPGVEAAKFAMANGAALIEKHFKLGKFGPGRATPWDAVPEELEEIIRYRNILFQIKGNQIDKERFEWLCEEEKKARERFLKRWKNE